MVVRSSRARARSFVLALLATLAAPIPGRAQAPIALPVAPGYRGVEVLRETGHPVGFGGFAPGIDDGALYFAVDHAVYLRDPHGAVSLVHAFPVGSRCDLLVRPPRATQLFFADDRSGVLHVRDLTSGAETLRSLPANSFDLEWTAQGDVLVAANPAWPAAGAHPGIWLLDPIGVAHREIIALGGASGPLAFDPQRGDLLCATASEAFPPPPGAVRVLRFAAARVAAAIAGGPVLGEVDATTVLGGFDSAFDLAFDDRGALFVSNALDGRVERIAADGRRDPSPWVAASGRSVLGLAFVDGPIASFDAYQPASGGTLWIGSSDWSATSTVHAIHAARPVASSRSGATAGAGNLAIDVAGLPGRQSALLLFNPLPLSSPEPTLAGIQSVPLFCALDWAVPPLAASAVSDPLGQVRFDLPYGGGLSWTLAFQVVAVTTDQASGGSVLITSNALTVGLLP